MTPPTFVLIRKIVQWGPRVLEDVWVNADCVVAVRSQAPIEGHPPTCSLEFAGSREWWHVQGEASAVAMQLSQGAP